MINLIATNGLRNRKQFLGLFCNVEEAKGYGQAKVQETGSSNQLLWKELPEGDLMREAFMIGSLLPVSVLRANYEESCLVILDYGF